MCDRELSLGVFGSTGRLGRQLVARAHELGVPVVLAVSRSGSSGNAAPRVVIDASSREGAPSAVRYCTEQRIPLVEMVSSLDDATLDGLHELAQHVPVVRATNLSMLHALQAQIAEAVAKASGALGGEVTVVERHPRTKADRPSRTALELVDVIGAGGARASLESLRFGGPVSDHAVVLSVGSESLAITHSVTSLGGVAARAVEMARRLISRTPGMWDPEEMG